MSEQNFWKLIETSWADSPELDKKRMKALETNDENLLYELDEALCNYILENYKNRLRLLDKERLTQFIHILEEKLYTIDRQEIHAYTDGSDDGFLYCRFFIVGMGELYYNRINDTPSKATFDLEAETFGFSAYGIFRERFGADFGSCSVHSIETCSNVMGWTS